uniref:Protein-PII uridylyltransferase N-terminal domain-containing protein n=1 Tax=Branchiostoma floridae TaxID=7739 RepID=C3ZTD2_BRAFL|eukprot:XP_002588168.1 hypothetical protein BRAFLDRAFT_68806 [Branchiostoma floridae]
MLRVCEKLCDADAKGRRYGLASAETGYLRALVDAMADMDRLAEVELLKSLGDVNLEKGRFGKDAGKLSRALELYMAAVVRCDHKEQGESIEHRYEYTEKVLQGVLSKGSHSKEQPTLDKGKTTPAKVSGEFQDMDRKWATGVHIDSVLVGFAQLMVEGIINGNSMLETEAIKSLGDVYLERGTQNGDTRDLTRATALYSTAMARCHDVHGNVVLVHRLLYTAKVRQVIATIKYIQTADRDLGNGDLDAAEQNIADALKLIHGSSNTNKAKEADCLCRLGDIYVERGKQTGEGRKFTQAAALYNASMARTERDKENMITRLQETEKQLLRYACNLDCEPCPYSNALDHRKGLDSTRARVKSQLERIHQEHNPYQYDEDDPAVKEIEIKRAEAIKNLFKSIAVERQGFIQALTDECIAKLGPPPCKYAFIGLGSQATELVTPYSDLEFAILIEEGKDDDDTRRYFLNLTHYIHLKVINLGETILPAMAIPSLNDFLSEDPEKDVWFFDTITPRGFAFDGFMPWASKTPFGRDETKSKPPISLIQTPAKLAEYQDFNIALAEGYHLSDILRRVAYLTGDEALVEEYTDRVNQIANRSLDLARHSAMLTLEDDIRKIKDVERTGVMGQLLDVKKEIYRFPSVVVDMLSICCGLTISSVWTMIDEFYRTERISPEDAHHLTVLISISAELRLRTYIANGGQKDKLSPLTEMKVQLDKHDVDDTFVESVFYIPNSKMLFRYYYTAIPLKRCIMDTVAKASPTTKMFPIAIYDTSSLTRGRMTKTLYYFDASICHLNTALKEADSDEKKQFEILFELGNVLTERGDCKTAIRYYEWALRLGNAIYKDSKVHRDIALLLDNFGLCMNELGDQSKAICYHEQSLKMWRDIHGNNTAHPDIAVSLHNIGTCWYQLGNHKKAIWYYKQSLKMMKASGGDNKAYISRSYGNIGICWRELGEHRKAISYYEESLKMRRDIYGETTAHPDIATSLHNFAACWRDLGDHRKAIRYYEQSLKTMKVIYGETAAHPDIAKSFNNIGKCWNDLGNISEALIYYEQSLNMVKAIYGETTPHPDIASSLNNIGSCWSRLGDQSKALKYYELSLKMRKAIYGDTTPHPDIAASLNNIGKCWSDLGDQSKSIRYYEQSLNMIKTIYGETAKHPDIASSLHNIGTCWSDLGDHKTAITYYKQALKMRKNIYSETTEHPDIASSLMNIGACFMKLGDQRKAISSYEQSLKMLLAIYSETEQHPDIAICLNNIGNCLNLLGDQTKAITYYEQALKMRKAIYGETTPHPDISSSLSNIGSCWGAVGNQGKAMSYFEQSLEMSKAIYGETTAHPDIASSLRNIGKCFSDFGDQRKAIKFHEQSLEIMKTIYGETKAHPDIASSLNNIGTCWSHLGNPRRAIGYFGRSLKMAQAIFGETAVHPDIASSLSNIGTCFSYLGDQSEAINCLEQSLIMMKAIYGDKAHPDIASCVNNIGACWCYLGDQRKAISYFEQSLAMMKVIFGDNTSHPSIASILEHIGTCWSKLGEQRKAISYFEQSLAMMKAIYGDNTPHPNIASILQHIGTCWSKLGEQRKAVCYVEQSLKMLKAIRGTLSDH